jgi:putative endopeptidase
MKKSALILGSAMAALLLYRCGNHTPEHTEDKGPDLLRSNMDTTVDPGTDFFSYANGGWLKKNPIPSTESSWGIFQLVDLENNSRLKKLSEDAAASKGSAKGTPTQLIGDFYATGMDSAAIDRDGITPLADEMKKIDAITDKKGVLDMVALLQTYGIGPLFGMYVGQDAMNSEVMALQLSQGGLGMPNRDYYFNTDSRTQKVREEYKGFMQHMFALVNDKDAKKTEEELYAFERSLAKASRKLEDLRNPYTNYHKMKVEEMDKLCPSIRWEDMFAKAGAKEVKEVIVGQPEFFHAVDSLVQHASIATWKNYLRWQFLTSLGDKLGGEFDKAHFHFYGTVLKGQEQQKPRWKIVMDDENNLIGEMLGQLFVKEYFPEASKKRYSDLVDAVIASYEEHIKSLPWMSGTTKEKALVKLHAIKKKVGYPDKWKDFSAMDISRQPYVRNVINADKWWWNYEMNKLGKPVDRTEWDMTPQEYNAYYDASNNEIVLPAAIFAIPGLKDADADDALVYGYAAASTIGHELTHGFDDEGRQYDEKGNLKSWWLPEDSVKFAEITKRYVQQFSNYVVLDSLHVNGEATLGENIADLGGIMIAFDAFKKTEQYKKGEKIGGLTPTQRYFLGYALGWLMQQKNERLSNQILTDVHAPANLRVNGPFSNIPEFYEAFGIREGKSMWRPDSSRVKIW